MAEGKALANSRDVAAYFGKAHRHVMRAVRGLLAADPDLGPPSFGLTLRPDRQGKPQPTYDMDRDGFTLLAMGFTGAKALAFRRAYIATFNRMEAELGGGAKAAAAAPENRRFPNWPLDEWRLKKDTVTLYSAMWGPASARWVMPVLGFPLPPRRLVPQGAQLSLALDG